VRERAEIRADGPEDRTVHRVRVDDGGHIRASPIDLAVNGILQVPGARPGQDGSIQVQLHQFIRADFFQPQAGSLQPEALR
jgi:hypothetical protein